ncbi:hypothetical protein [Kineococcus sp. SYSU DK018]
MATRALAGSAALVLGVGDAIGFASAGAETLFVAVVCAHPPWGSGSGQA